MADSLEEDEEHAAACELLIVGEGGHDGRDGECVMEATPSRVLVVDDNLDELTIMINDLLDVARLLRLPVEVEASNCADFAIKLMKLNRSPAPEFWIPLRFNFQSTNSPSHSRDSSRGILKR